MTFCLEVKKFWFQNQSFLGSLSLVEDPDWHILVLRGDSHLSKVVIKKIEANGGPNSQISQRTGTMDPCSKIIAVLEI